MGRLGEIVAFGLGGLAVYLGSRLLVELRWLIFPDDAGMFYLVGWVYAPALLVLGYVAGTRRSPAALVAAIVGYLVPWLVAGAWAVLTA